MRFNKWLLLSLALHLIAVAVYTFKLSLKPEFKDLTSIELKTAVQQTSPVPIRHFSDKGENSSKKTLPDTNKQPPAQEDAVTGTSTTNYVPSYMADALPEAITPIQPVYPEEARRQGIEGKVVMQVFIDAGGIVQRVDVIKTSGEMLADSAKKAVMAVRFRPARIGGEFRAVVMQLTLRFHLE